MDCEHRAYREGDKVSRFVLTTERGPFCPEIQRGLLFDGCAALTRNGIEIGKIYSRNYRVGKNEIAGWVAEEHDGALWDWRGKSLTKKAISLGDIVAREKTSSEVREETV